MTILLYDYRELEEKASNQLKAWKAWHLIMYALAAIFGLLNYVFLQNAMALVDNHCVLFPRQLSFKLVEVPIGNTLNQNVGSMTKDPSEEPIYFDNSNMTERNETTTNSNDEENLVTDVVNADLGEDRLVLDTSRTLFATDSECEFAEYMPVLSLIFAATWATMFTMCPGGGHSRTGLPQPWRILAPSLIFALVMVGLTGHSFTRTNKGITDFCAAFYNFTNSTSCSAVDGHLEKSWATSWSFGGRAIATRLASAGMWASWACACILFLVRCLTAPDFKLRHTRAYLKDPNNKLTPYLKRSRRQRSSVSPTKRDTTSVKSEPTMTTELVTVSIEQGQETAPTSLQATPEKTPAKEAIELTTASSYLEPKRKLT